MGLLQSLKLQPPQAGFDALKMRNSGVSSAPVPPARLPPNYVATPAPVGPALPPKKPAPPADALARAGDGRKFWRPAPPNAGTPPAVERSWLVDLLRFYRVGAPTPPDASGTRCSFNGATMTTAAALDIVDAQVRLNGYAPSRSTAEGLVRDLMREVAQAGTLGDQVAANPKAYLAELGTLAMPKLLLVMDRLKALRKLDDLADQRGITTRIGAAILTVQGQFEDVRWQSALPKLSDADRAAILMRAPAKVVPISPGPARKGEKPEAPIDVEALVAVGKDGVEMQVKIVARSPFGRSVGETEGSVHIGPDGKISQFELDVKAFQASLKGQVVEVTITVSGNATIDLAKGGTKIAPDGINAQIKGEIAARLTRVKALSGVSAKLTGTYGTERGAVTVGLEFKIPGS